MAHLLGRNNKATASGGGTFTQKLNDANQKESQELLTAVKEGSIVTWQHINFHGEYDFSEEKLRDSVGLNIPKILSWKRDENQE